MPKNVNQKPEQVARDQIDDRLRAAGWNVQDKDAIDFTAGLGIAVREYQTDIGPADYVLFVDRQAVGVVEAKPDDWGAKLNNGRRAVGGLRQCQTQVGLERRTSALPVREHGADHAFHERPRPQFTLSGSIHFPPTEDVPGLDPCPTILSIRHRLAPDAEPRRPARVPAQGDHQS